MIAVLILAAGASSRMRGADKLLMAVRGTTLLADRIAMAASVATTLVTLPPRPHPRWAQAAGAIAVPVPGADVGLSASLKCGIRALPPQARGVLILPADMPDITATDLQTLLNARADNPDALICQATTEDGKPGHPVLFDAATFPLFAALFGDSGARPIIDHYADRVHSVPLTGGRARHDLDTPEDWTDWRANAPR